MDSDHGNPYRPPTAEGAQLPPTPFRRLRIVSVLLDVMGTILLILGATCGCLVARSWMFVGFSVPDLLGATYPIVIIIAVLIAVVGFGALFRRGPSWVAGTALMAAMTIGAALAVPVSAQSGWGPSATIVLVLMTFFGAGGLLAYRLGAPLFGAQRITRKQLWAGDEAPGDRS